MNIENIMNIVSLVCATIVAPICIVALHIVRSCKEKETNKKIEEDAKMINRFYKEPSPKVIEQIKELEKRVRGE